MGGWQWIGSFVVFGVSLGLGQCGQFACAHLEAKGYFGSAGVGL